MNEVQKGSFPLGGLMSLLFSLAIAFLSFLMYSMMLVGFLPFASFEGIAVTFTAIPLTVGIISLIREKRKLMAIIGVVIAALTLLWLFILMAANGM